MANSSLDDQTSLTGSLGDFSDSSADKQQSPLFGLPSQHSGFQSCSEPEPDEEVNPGEEAESDDSPWSPPAWRQPTSGWYRHQPYSQDVQRLKSQSTSTSRGTSKGYESAKGDEDEDPTKIPLPRDSVSPKRETSMPTAGSSAPSKETPPPIVEEGLDFEPTKEQDTFTVGQTSSNCL